MASLRQCQESLLALALLLFVQGCVATIPSLPESFPSEGPVAFGRIHVVLTGPTTRWYTPEIRFIELYNHTIDKRFRLEIGSEESLFAASLPAGDYRITRVQITEGGFRGMADLMVSFRIDSDKVNYLGTWTFAVASPYYNRELVLTVSSEMVRTWAEVNMSYQDLQPRMIINNLAQPATIKARLFEVTPYPGVRWFRRHAAS